MILTPSEYSKRFTVGKKLVSASTVKRRCAKNLLPSGHNARKLPGAKGTWAIEVRDNKD
jgi:hypothetical protein